MESIPPLIRLFIKIVPSIVRLSRVGKLIKSNLLE